jgi:hypothetical protein
LPWARQMEDLQTVVPALVAAALAAHLHGRFEAAADLIEELARTTGHSAPWRSRHLPTALKVLVASDKLQEAEGVVPRNEPPAVRDRNCVLTAQAIIKEARGEMKEAGDLYHDCARRWADYGFVLEEGQAYLGLARCLIALGQRVAATEPLQKARAIFVRLRAIPLIDEVDRHLGQQGLAP